MPKGGTIRIRTENLEIGEQSIPPLPSGRYIRIEIGDEGVGIAEKHLARIFDPFFTTKQKGSGLGLSTAYSIIKKHEGHISVRSEPEKGAVFDIYIPASEKPFQRRVAETPDIPKGQGKILVMDDQESILNMVRRFLEKIGYTVEVAIDGEQAVELYRNAFMSQHSFDIVILDVTIPGGMGGEKTILELMKIDPEVKAVVSSGYSNDPVMANYEEYGFCGVIPKPYRMNELARVIHELSEK